MNRNYLLLSTPVKLVFQRDVTQLVVNLAVVLILELRVDRPILDVVVPVEIRLILVLVIQARDLPISEPALIFIPELTPLRFVIEVRLLHVLVQREHIHDQRNQWLLL